MVDNAQEKNIIGYGYRHYEVSARLEVQQMQTKEELKLANSKVHELTLITRDQAACQAAEEQVDTELSSESGAMPFQFSDEMYGDEEAEEVDYKQLRMVSPLISLSPSFKKKLQTNLV